MFKRIVLFPLALFIVLSLVVGAIDPLAAQTKKADTPKVEKADKVDIDEADDQAERAQKATAVLNEIMGIPEQAIPQELMSKAKGIAVIPHVIKGALGIGGRYGKGLMSQRLANGKWSAPTFVDIGGGSVGFQIGVEATDLVMVFTNEEGVRSLLDGKVTLGADASVAAGPVGRKAGASTDIKLDSAIYTYSRSKGLFAGVSLDGAALTINDSSNEKVYGKGAKTENIFANKFPANRIVAPFIAALEKHSPATRSN